MKQQEEERRCIDEKKEESSGENGDTLCADRLVERVSKLELLSWTSVQPRDSGRHVKENKRSILDGPFVEGLARGFYVHI